MHFVTRGLSTNEIAVEENHNSFALLPPRSCLPTPPPERCSSNPAATFISYMNSTSRSHSISDPITAALLPPPNESVADREKRLRAEEHAKKISDDIDEMLKAERNEVRKKNPVKVLLLGQSESGKSTTLKRTSMLVFSSPAPSSLTLTLPNSPQSFNCSTPQRPSTRNASPGVSSSISTSFVQSEESSTPFPPITRPSTPISWTTRTTRTRRPPP